MRICAVKVTLNFQLIRKYLESGNPVSVGKIWYQDVFVKTTTQMGAIHLGCGYNASSSKKVVSGAPLRKSQKFPQISPNPKGGTLGRLILIVFYKNPPLPRL
eukprot:COSAG05_NODE_57_length_23291_cov_75.862668_20_plen_102_part_00